MFQGPLARYVIQWREKVFEKIDQRGWNEPEWWHCQFDGAKLPLQDVLFSLSHTINFGRNDRP